MPLVRRIIMDRTERTKNYLDELEHSESNLTGMFLRHVVEAVLIRLERNGSIDEIRKCTDASISAERSLSTNAPGQPRREET
jgi:hypothetical protein